MLRNKSGHACICIDGDDHNPLNVPEVPQPPSSDPTLMFVPGDIVAIATL